MTPQATRRLFIVFILIPKEVVDGEQCDRLRCKVECGWSQCRRWGFYCDSDEAWCHTGPKDGAGELLQVLKSEFIVSFWSVWSKLEACWGCTVRHCLQSEIISFFTISLGEHHWQFLSALLMFLESQSARKTKASPERGPFLFSVLPFCHTSNN